MKTIFTLLVLFTTVTFTVDSQNQGYDIGDVATDFKLKNIDGNTISLSDFKEAKGFIVIFTCNTCPYAVAYEDRIEALNKKYAPKGYPVIAIMPNNVKTKPGDSMKADANPSARKRVYVSVFDGCRSVYLPSIWCYKNATYLRFRIYGSRACGAIYRRD